MLARASLNKESTGKSKAKRAPAADASTQFFAPEEQREDAIAPPKFSWNFGDVQVSAPGDNNGLPPTDGKPTAFHRRTVEPLPWPMQAKLEVGAVDDPLEREADRVTEEVMSAADPTAQTSLPASPMQFRAAGGNPMTSVPRVGVQRKCSCGGSCDKCKSEQRDEASEKIQRKSVGHQISSSDPSHAIPRSTAPPIVHEVLRAPGQPLDSAARNYFEPRFAHDFSRVRVHTDSGAAESARSIKALAYTVGDRIVFGAGQYSPGTEMGRRLLAHELTHSIQQTLGAKPLVQRAVTKDWDKLRDYLTYGVFDWAITDADAHKSLTILKGLNPTDLKDTVAAMEKEGWVRRLFHNVSKEDKNKETDLLDRINDVRVHKGKEGEADVVGSCDQKQQKQIDDRVQGSKDWARESKERVNKFAAEPDKHADTSALLETHFFHEKNNGPMTPADRVSKAQAIALNFEEAELQANPWPNTCASPFDPLCASLALAYNDPTKQRIVFCKSYFGQSEERQTYFLLHELTHKFAGVDDRGYGNERIFAYLAVDDAVNNADSYALFAVDVNAKKETSARLRPVAKDRVTHCDFQEPYIRRSFAFAARMITNALNVIGDPRLAAAEALAHFKTSDRTKLQDVIDRFKKIDDIFAGSLNFECEKKCGSETGYYRTGNRTVHLCPGWFMMAEPARTHELLFIAVAAELGIDYGPRLGTPEYASLTEKKAKKSAMAYVGYAREVTTKWFP